MLTFQPTTITTLCSTAVSRIMTTRFFLAAVLLVMSLGLPWSVKSGELQMHYAFQPGYIVPGGCWWVGSEIKCDQATFSFGIGSYDSSLSASKSIHGAAHQARFGVVAGLVLMALGWRLRRRHYFALAGVCVAVMSVLTVGLKFGHAGAYLAWLAALILFSMSGVGHARAGAHAYDN